MGSAVLSCYQRTELASPLGEHGSNSGRRAAGIRGSLPGAAAPLRRWPSRIRRPSPRPPLRLPMA